MNESLLVQIPGNVENLQLPDPTLLKFYQNLESRIIWMDTEIDETYLDIVKYILQWNKEDYGKAIEDRTPIKIFFACPGGSLSVTNALIDIIILSKTPVWGINTSIAYSGGAFLMLACHKRYGLQHASLMLHQGSGAFSGTYAEIMPGLIEYQQQIEQLAQFVASRTKYSAEEIADNLVSDWYIDIAEGLEKGVYDEIIDDISVLF